MFEPTREEVDELRSKGFGMQESIRFLKIKKLKKVNGSSEPFVQQMIIAEILNLL